MQLRWIRLIFLFVLLAIVVPPARASGPPVYVILWFDTEDYILPADDDAAKHIAEFLTRQKIRGHV